MMKPTINIAARTLYAPALILLAAGTSVTAAPTNKDTKKVASSTFKFKTPVALTYKGGNVLTTEKVEGKHGRSYASAHFADLDGDNKKDLITGDVMGNMRVYQNIGTAEAPKFAEPKLLRLANGDIAVMKNW